jgi:hypothetical protein
MGILSLGTEKCFLYGCSVEKQGIYEYPNISLRYSYIPCSPKGAEYTRKI